MLPEEMSALHKSPRQGIVRQLEDDKEEKDLFRGENGQRMAREGKLFMGKLYGFGKGVFL